MDNYIIVCPNPNCGCKLRLPAGRGRISATCPQCKTVFLFNSNIGRIETGKPPAKPKAAPVKKPAPPAKPPAPPVKHPVGGGTQQAGSMRDIALFFYSENVGTALRKASKFLLKNTPIKIIVDGKLAGEMVDHKPTVIRVSDAEHSLCLAISGIPAAVALNAKLSGLAAKIPAGREDCIVYIEKIGATEFYPRVGYRQDSFLDGLKAYFKKLSSGHALQERIHLAENRNDCVYLTFEDDGFRLEWDVGNPKGFQQWSTGRNGEKISYAQLGLQPPAARPGGYWQFVNFEISNVIDESEDLQCLPGGKITERRMHSLV